ncbi:hypothetical protein BD626DRAFT_484081 [Schizophyllum amplum]|uniref:Uncharacterized protein n=1 Tax=Schizophyllum amplum TaxID=97359 RepID=A0A550CQ02_9AGAR|nr:hypothetical protein BD626DRAFT_484081 [Auriculariopsis ampla]
MTLLPGCQTAVLLLGVLLLAPMPWRMTVALLLGVPLSVMMPCLTVHVPLLGVHVLATRKMRSSR